MHSTTRIVFASLFALAACAHSAAVAPTTPSPVSRAPAPAPTPTPTLGAPSLAVLAVHRAQMIEWLGEYAEAGAYPIDDQGWPLSVFRDSRGVRCPMAELIFRSGHPELVDAVVRTDNALRLADVHAGPLAAWMADSGLTRDEIIMVQGAANLPMLVDSRPLQVVQIAAATGRVHGRLDTAAIALRDHTPDSLAAAAKAARRSED